jgi:glycosyltransferase involved in cell wall biosynthesis
MPETHPLRVAFIAGSLGQGGAEQQLLYLTRELRRAHVEVHVFTLSRGERYEPLFEEAGVPITFAGHHRVPWRIADLAVTLRRFRPHVIQAGHFFTNLYVVAAARLSGAAEIGAIRNDMHFDMAECGRWGHALLHVPRTMIANSRAAARNAQGAGVDERRLHVLTNVIDLMAFDRASGGRHVDTRAEAVAIAVARLVPAKRIDRLLRALARARRMGARLRGVIVGDGPERGPLEALARELGLQPGGGVAFFGARGDVPRLMARADLLVLTSQHEGFPNVLLEAMTARLPVVTTPAGDAADLVRDGQTGFIVPFDDEEILVRRLIELARSPATRRVLGSAGRAHVEACCGLQGLAERALTIYHDAARQQRSARTLHAVDALAR